MFTALNILKVVDVFLIIQNKTIFTSTKNVNTGLTSCMISQ